MIKEENAHKSNVYSLIGFLTPILVFTMVVLIGPYFSQLNATAAVVFWIFLLSSFFTVTCSLYGLYLYGISHTKHKEALVFGVLGILLSVLLFILDIFFYVIFVVSWG